MNHEHAITLLRNGYVKEAIRLLRLAVQSNPNDQAAYVNLCLAQESLGQFDKAEKGYRWLLASWPNNVEAASNLGNLLARSGRSGEAAVMHGKVLSAHPDDLYSLDALAKVQCEQGRIEEAVANLKRVAELTQHPRAWSEYLSYGLHVGHDAAAHEMWAERFAVPLLMPRPVLPYDGHRPIRVGYVSNTWDRHSVSAFILPILRGHSDSVHVTLYSDIETPPDLKQAADHFENTRRFNHFAFGAKVRNDGIDVLVELDGHKANSRLLVMATSPAPVLGTMNGYLPDTHLTENFNLGWAFAPYADAPPVASLPAGRNGCVTFGSFNRAHKITQPVAAAWAAVLAAVPASRLLVAAKGGEANGSVRERLEAAGVPPGRLMLAAPHEAAGDYLRALGGIDIHLDPFPFSGVSITCDLLWQGVPSVTWERPEPQGHSTADILRTIGLDDLVARSETEYVARAASMAADLTRLRELRTSLRERMAPLLDGRPLARRLESLYRERLTASISGRSMAATLAHGAVGIARALTGTGGAARELIEQRTAICGGCDKAVVLGGMFRQCSLCGCSTWMKVRNKEEKCPIGKW